MKRKLLTLLVSAGLFNAAMAGDFSLTSPTFQSGKRLGDVHVFKGFGCDGENLSPAMSWKNPPKGTKSFAVTLYDPDAPTGSGWWHWVVYNLPEATRDIAAGAGTPEGKNLPAGAKQGRTDFGSASFGGACPPQGDPAHRYQLTVYALKVDKLDVPADASAALIGFMIHANKLGSATIQAKYGR